jgi:hypothetical protein
LQGENIQNAVVINTCGEAVPIPTAYCTAPYSNDAYAYYGCFLGQMVRLYNWTWASIVGYPFYYVSNIGYFSGQNDWGVYGMKSVAAAGLNSFLRGLDGKGYVTDTIGWITSELPSVPLSVNAIYYTNYYGIYPAAYQTATRALPIGITSTYNLTVTASLFDTVSGYRAGAVYRNAVSGGFLALGLTRTPDIRLTALGLLSDFKPRLYNSEYTANGTSRLVVLQLGLVGGV